jgi:chemotaxis protein MotB
MTTRERKKKKQVGEGAGFAVLFTSLSIILLAFFILLNSMAVIDQNRKRLALGSLIGSFKILPGGKRFTKGEKLLMPSAPLLPEAGLNALEDLDAFANTQALTNQVSWYLRDYGVVVSLADSILFPWGSSEVSTEAKAVLERVAKVIRQFPKHVEVEGHTDNGPLPPGPYQSHWELSGIQAVNVVRYLVEKLELEPKRFAAVGFGALWPLEPNNSKENRAKNRRVEIVLRGNFQALHPKVIEVEGFLFPVQEIWRW